MRNLALILSIVALPACEWLPIEHPTSPPPQIGDTWQGQEPGPDSSSWAGPDTASAVQRNPNQFPTIFGALAIGNGTKNTLVLRVRPLLASVQLDCAQVAKAPSQWLSRNLFAPAQIWQVQAGRTFAAPEALQSGASKPACSAVLLDGGNMPMALLFWQAASYPAQSMPSTVTGAALSRLVLVQDSGEGVQLAGHPALFAAPPTQPASTPPGCAFGKTADALEWTEPGPSGDQTVVDIATAPNGCHVLDLLSKTGIQTWTVCLPPGSMPFEPGDDFFASPLQGGHNLGQIQGFDLLGASGKRLRVGRGQDVVYFGKGSAQIEPLLGCGVGHDACGSALLPLAVKVGQGSAMSTLVAGQSAAAGAGKLAIARAFDVPVRNAACAGAPGLGRWVESVYAESAYAGGEAP